MTRRWLEQAIETEYLPAIRALGDTTEGRTQAEALNQQIRQEWHDRGSKTLIQQQGLMDDTRKALKAALGKDHWILNYIKFTSQEYTEINNLKQNRVAARNEATQQLENPDEIVATAVRLLDSPDWANLAAGLATLTGRRVAEVLSTAKFEKKSQWSVIFSGALKRRGEPVELSFEIPTLATADRIIEALSRLRAELPEATQMEPGEINKKYEPAVATACDRAFAKLVPAREGKDSLYSHLFRAIYATIATFWYCPPSVNEVEFRAAIQGHYAILDEQNPELRRSLAASRHYSDYEISDKEIAHYNGKRKGIKLGVAGIEPIEQFKEAWRRGMEPKAHQAKKDRSSYRIWKEDKVRLDRILEPFKSAGTHQQDRFHAFLDWFESQQDLLTLPTADTTEPEPTSTETTPTDTAPADTALTEAIPMQTQPASPNSDHPELDEVAPPTPTASPAVASTTDSKIDRLIDTMTQFMQVMMASTSAQTVQTVRPTQPAKTTRQKQTPAPTNGSTSPSAADSPIDLDKGTAAPTEKLTHTPRTRAGVEETANRLNQAIDAIMRYNDAPDRRHDDKWAIGINTLKSLGVKSQEAIVQAIGGRNRKQEEVTGTRQAEIESHHAKHQIDPDKHNYKHRNKATIDRVISLD